MSKKIFVTGIKVKEGGMKGLEVSYCHQEEKDGKTWNIEDWQDRKIPIGEKLDEVIKAFRFYLMDIFGYDMKEANAGDCKIKEIKFDGDIVLSGELRVLNGDRTVNLKTCKIDESCEYERYDELNKLIGQMKDEINLYMEGKSIMSEKQLVMQFYQGKKGFDEAEFAGLSEEQLEEKYTAALEKMGAIVIRKSDMNATAESEVPAVAFEDPREFKESPAIAAEQQIAAPNFDAPPVQQAAPAVEAKVISPNFGAAEENPADLVKSTEEEGDVFSITPVSAIN
jgi:hypothetical protein